eukprot:scaffold45512_cov31-Tisochrysis_lutea.AAC.3
MSKMQDARCKMHRKCSMSHVERAISQVLVLVTRHYAIIMIMSYELLLLTCCVLYKCHLQMRATECRMRGMRQVQACASRKLWLILVMVVVCAGALSRHWCIGRGANTKTPLASTSRIDFPGLGGPRTSPGDSSLAKLASISSSAERARAPRLSRDGGVVPPRALRWPSERRALSTERPLCHALALPPRVLVSPFPAPDAPPALPLRRAAPSWRPSHSSPFGTLCALASPPPRLPAQRPLPSTWLPS